MQLFSSKELTTKHRPPKRDRRRRRRIPTGAPRLEESATDRFFRTRAESWAALIDRVRQSAIARLELLKDIEGDRQLGCPWEKVIACDQTCRCRGTRFVTVDFLRDHYAHLVVEIVKLVTPGMP